MCLCLYFLDLVSLMPSMIEAWFSSSDKITSSGPQICSQRPLQRRGCEERQLLLRRPLDGLRVQGSCWNR